MFERRLYLHIDWLMIVAILALTSIGLAMIYSTSGAAAGGSSRMFVTQLYALAIGLVAMTVCLLIDYRTLAESSHIIYVLLALALLFVLFFGVVRGGGRRWISLGAVNLQPSEFARIAVSLVLAKLLEESWRGLPSTHELAMAGGFTLLPMALIARQPDLGTAVTLVPVGLAIAYMAGMRLKFLWVLLAIALVSTPIVWRFVLHDYQKSRVVTFLDPERDPRGAGYQQIQARVTVGSGGALGKGYTRGTQGQLRFLPVASTDFIFSALAEETGFAGVVSALALYLFVICGR